VLLPAMVRFRCHRSETCAPKRVAFAKQKVYFEGPEYVPKPRRVSDGIAGAYIATNKEEPQR
jgi:hypothetical protein